MATNVRNKIPQPQSESASSTAIFAANSGLKDTDEPGPGPGHAFLNPESREVKVLAGKRYRYCKRWMDLGLVVITSPLLIALFTLVAVVVRLSSRGPVFFKHQRIGRYGRPFTMFKFRTMKVGSEQILLNHLLANPAAHQEWMLRHKLCDDPRLTPCGRFLRTVSLDELPQIWNVLRGDMSLVGPRPIIQAEKSRYGDRFRYYSAVVPGLTGLWQVSGRCNLTYQTRVALDVEYVRQWNLGRDLKILFKTPLTVCRREGAY